MTQMQLVIKNFKCHKELVVDIKDHETTIIAGESGRGKTTIIDALLWCLYGSMSMIRGCKDNCTVTLTMTDGFKIERMRRPKRLIVRQQGNAYTDDYAQHIIDEMFGSEKLFTSTSVIEQGSLNGFFAMTPGEKFKLITDMVFEDNGDESIEQKVTVRLNQVKNSYSALESQYNTLLASYDRFVAGINFRSLDVDTVDDLKTYDVKTVDVPSVMSQVSHLTMKLEQAIRAETAYQSQLKQIERVQQQLKDLESTPLPPQPVDAETDVTPLMRRLASLDHELKEAKRFDVLVKTPGVQQIIDVLGDNHPDVMMTVPATLVSEDELKRYDEMTGLIKGHRGASLSPQLKNIKKSVGELKSMKDSLSDKVRTLSDENESLQSELKSISGAVKCPHCQGHVIIKGSTLHPLSSVKDGREQEIRSRLREVSSDMIKQNGLLETVNQALALCSNLSDGDVPATIIAEFEDLKAEYSRFKIRDVEMQKMCKLPYETMKVIAQYNNRTVMDAVRAVKTLRTRPVHEIETDIHDINVKVKSAQKVSGEWKVYRSICDDHRTKVDMVKSHLKQLMSVRKPEEGLVDRLRAMIAEENQRCADVEAIKRRNDVINRTHAERQRLLREESQIYQMQETGTQLYSDLVMLEKLKVRIKDIIATAVDTRLNEISILINHYLTQMFSVPITVEMKSHREVLSTGAKKNEINFAITLDRRETDIKSLSGGERSRLSMAFTLALNSLSCATYKLLIMDESLSGLDEGNRETCIDIIEERCKTTGITSISVLHGCDEGAFDNIIRL